MFDNVYLNSLVILLAVFIITGITIFVYNFLVEKNKLIKQWEINLREYSVYVKYNIKNKTYTIDCFQPMENEGINNLKEYLSCPVIAACGGSYMVTAELIDNQKWDEITELCKKSVEIVKEARK